MLLKEKQIRFWLKQKFGLSASGENDLGLVFAPAEDGRLEARASNVFGTLEVINTEDVSKILEKDVVFDPRFEEIVMLNSPTGLGETEADSVLDLYRNFSTYAPMGQPFLAIPSQLKDGQDHTFIRHQGFYRLITENHPLHDHVSPDLYDFTRVALHKTPIGNAHKVEFLPFQSGHFHLMAV